MLEDDFIESVDVILNTQYAYRGMFKINYADTASRPRKYITTIYQKLAVVRDKNNHEGCYIMNIIPSKTHSITRKNSVSAQFRRFEDSDFTGMVIYNSLTSGATARVDVFDEGRKIACASIFDDRYTYEENADRMKAFFEGAVIYKVRKVITRGSEFDPGGSYGGGDGSTPIDPVVVIGTPGGGGGGGVPPGVIWPPRPPTPQNPDPNPGGGNGGGGNGNPSEPNNPDEEAEENEDKPLTITLSTSSSCVTVMETYSLTADITGGSIPSISKVVFFMQSEGAVGNWVKIYEESNASTTVTYSRVARVPRKWQVKADVFFTDTTTKSSDVIIVEEQSPDKFQILNGAGVRTHFDARWQRAIDYGRAHKSTYEVMEFGCWVYLDTATGSYNFDEVNSPSVALETGTMVVSTSFSMPFTPRPSPNDSGRFVVANFHTHFPLYWAKVDCERMGDPTTLHSQLKKGGSCN